MNWKKNVFSYFMWLLYTIAVGSGLFCVTAFWGRHAGYSLLICLLVSSVCLFAAGAIVFFLHFFAGAASTLREKKRLIYLLEGIAAIALLGAGLFLCIRNFPESYMGEGYYELAKVEKGQGVIQVVHGAVYLYLQLLHVVCILFGNKIAVCVWLQVVLYLLAAVVLYLAVRRLAGGMAATVMLAFMMFSPFLTAQSRALSPNMLFLLIYALALHLVAACLNKSHCSYFWYVLAGAVIGFVTYLDIMGVTLLFIMLCILFVAWEEENSKNNNRGAAFGVCLGSGVAGFFVCIALDTLLSGKQLSSVLAAWGSLYQPSQPAFPTVSYNGGAYADIVVLLFLMCMGIFSFWCIRKSEKISIWVLASGVLIGAQCFQITTDEMPGFQLLYLFLAVLAGIGISNVLAYSPIMLLVDEKEAENAQEAAKQGEVQEELHDEARTKLRAEVKAKPQTESQEEPQVQSLKPAPDIQYIENPLPLPKKHVAKTMDYRLKVDESKPLDYDYQIEDDDDYDI